MALEQFLSLGTADIVAEYFFIVEGCLVHYRKFSKIPDLYLLDTGNCSPAWFSCDENQKNVSRYCQMSLRGQNVPA